MNTNRKIKTAVKNELLLSRLLLFQLAKLYIFCEYKNLMCENNVEKFKSSFYDGFFYRLFF